MVFASFLPCNTSIVLKLWIFFWTQNFHYEFWFDLIVDKWFKPWEKSPNVKQNPHWQGRLIYYKKTRLGLKQPCHFYSPLISNIIIKQRICKWCLCFSTQTLILSYWLNPSNIKPNSTRWIYIPSLHIPKTHRAKRWPRMQQP